MLKNSLRIISRRNTTPLFFDFWVRPSVNCQNIYNPPIQHLIIELSQENQICAVEERRISLRAGSSSPIDPNLPSFDMTEKPELKIFERQKKSESIFDQKVVIHSLKIEFFNPTILIFCDGH